VSRLSPWRTSSSEDEERLVLASLDPLAAMADTDRDALALLLAEVTPSDQALTRMLAELADRNGIIPAGLGDPDLVPEVPDEADLYVEPRSLWRLGEQRPCAAMPPIRGRRSPPRRRGAHSARHGSCTGVA
jgi:hypothetical protein